MALSRKFQDTQRKHRKRKKIKKHEEDYLKLNPDSLIFRIQSENYWDTITLLKVPKYGVFLVRIFPHLDWIRRDMEYFYVFNPNAGKYGPEKTPYLDTFQAVNHNHFKPFLLNVLIRLDNFYMSSAQSQHSNVGTFFIALL